MRVRRPNVFLRSVEGVLMGLQWFGRYVALGHSQTVGVGDPGGNSGERGGAEGLAPMLAVANPGLVRANLAAQSKRRQDRPSDLVSRLLAREFRWTARYLTGRPRYAPMLGRKLLLASVAAVAA